MVCAKFGWNWPRGSWEEVEIGKVYRRTDRQTDRQTNRQTTEERRSEKLTWAFSSCVLKMNERNAWIKKQMYERINEWINVKRTWPGTGKITPLYLCYLVVGWNLPPSSGQEQARTAGWGWGIYWRHSPWGGALKDNKISYIILLYMFHFWGHECTDSWREICCQTNRLIYLPVFFFTFQIVYAIFKKISVHKIQLSIIWILT